MTRSACFSVLRNSTWHLRFCRSFSESASRGEREESNDDERRKSDTCPRNPRVFFGKPAFFFVAYVTNAVAVGICLVDVGIVRTIVADIRYTIAVKIFAHVPEPVAVNIRLVGIRRRNAVVARVRYAVGIRVGGYVARIRLGNGRGDPAHVSAVREIAGFSGGDDYASVGIEVDAVRVVRLGKKTQRAASDRYIVFRPLQFADAQRLHVRELDYPAPRPRLGKAKRRRIESAFRDDDFFRST